MAYWIVYQGNSWDRARRGGYLWAPKAGKKGQTQAYWSNMALVQPGDLIFSGVNNAVRAVSSASTPAYATDRPDPRDDAYWYGEGWRLDVGYTDLPRPLYYADWVPTVLTEMPSRHSPFTAAGKPVQGYLFALPGSVGEYLVSILQNEGFDVDGSAAAAATAPPADTVREALIRARVGQGKFRADLISKWGGRCPLSGVDRPELLRASHIKPWSGCNHAERLDPANGLLLSAAYDAAFDATLLSFDDDGAMILASDFPAEEAQAAGINPAACLGSIDNATREFLKFHRDLMFARASRVERARVSQRVS